jgi:predicted AAA+ superfamily ATPase
MNSLGIKASKNTLYNYLEYANDSYFLFYLKKFSYSLKDIERSIPKIYVIDNGIINVFSHRFSENIGRLMENLVFLNLRRKYRENKNIFYLKTRENYEVDFVVKEENRISKLIQVTYANSFDEINPREYRSLLHTNELFKSDKPELIMITWDYEDEKKLSWFGKEGTIKFVPLWKWLLKTFKKYNF